MKTSRPRTLHLYWLRVRLTPDQCAWWNTCLAPCARRAHQVLLRRSRILRAHLTALGQGYWLEVQLLGAARLRGRTTLPPGWSYATLPADLPPGA